MEETFTKVVEEQGTSSLAGFAEPERKRIVFEETGLKWELITTLLKIHLEENPDSVEELFSWINITAKYLELTLIHLTKTEDEILELFREYASSGKTTVIVKKVVKLYFPDTDISVRFSAFPVVFIAVYTFPPEDTPEYKAREEAREKALSIVIETTWAIISVYEFGIFDEPKGDDLTDFNNEKRRIIFEKTGLTWPQVGNLIIVVFTINFTLSLGALTKRAYRRMSEAQ